MSFIFIIFYDIPTSLYIYIYTTNKIQEKYNLKEFCDCADFKNNFLNVFL